ncbi:hypothetical protein Tco_1055390 [Tanacetum coccineum]|uniref:Uncharacterized protein n=1 Tax=Tanacetum coccineum TaxID=301880 RepID=A0ABQ5GZH8_9ASTR
MSLSAEVRMLVDFYIREKRRLSAIVEEKNLLLKTRDEEVANLKAQLLVKEAEATEAIRLRAEVQTLADRNIILEREKGELDIKVADLAATVKVREQEVADLDAVVHKLETSSAVLQDKVTAYDSLIGQLEKFQDDRIREMNEKLNKLDADLVKLALHLEEKFYPHLLTTISGSRWLLTHGLELAIAKCLNSTALSSYYLERRCKALDKGLQEDYLPEIIHGKGVEMKENTANDRSALYDVFVPLAEPLSISALEGIAGISGTAPGTTTALSMTFASTSTIPPISTDDYEFVHTDYQEVTDADEKTGTGADANPFPSIDNAELNVPE